AEDGIRDFHVTGVQTCALPICFHLFQFQKLPYLSFLIFGCTCVYPIFSVLLESILHHKSFHLLSYQKDFPSCKKPLYEQCNFCFEQKHFELIAHKVLLAIEFSS